MFLCQKRCRIGREFWLLDSWVVFGFVSVFLIVYVCECVLCVFVSVRFAYGWLWSCFVCLFVTVFCVCFLWPCFFVICCDRFLCVWLWPCLWLFVVVCLNVCSMCVCKCAVLCLYVCCWVSVSVLGCVCKCVVVCLLVCCVFGN